MSVEGLEEGGVEEGEGDGADAFDLHDDAAVATHSAHSALGAFEDAVGHALAGGVGRAGRVDKEESGVGRGADEHKHVHLAVGDCLRCGMPGIAVDVKGAA